LNRLVDFHEIWHEGNVIQVALDAIIFNPISSTILKWLRFKVVSWGHDFHSALHSNGLGLFNRWVIIGIV
jgi:hypothetical protein